MLNKFKNVILVLLLVVICGVAITMNDEPNKYWVMEQVGVQGGQIMDVSEDGIDFRIGDHYVTATWEYAEDYFKDLND